MNKTQDRPRSNVADPDTEGGDRLSDALAEHTTSEVEELYDLRPKGAPVVVPSPGSFELPRVPLDEVKAIFEGLGEDDVLSYSDASREVKRAQEDDSWVPIVEVKALTDALRDVLAVQSNDDLLQERLDAMSSAHESLAAKLAQPEPLETGSSEE